MKYEKVSPPNAAVVVATLGDLQRKGGLVSREKKRLAVLPMQCHALIDGKACGLFFDERDGRYRIITACAVTGGMYALGTISAKQLRDLIERQGIFYKEPSVIVRIPPPEVA